MIRHSRRLVAGLIPEPVVLMMVMITLIANSFGTGIAGGLLFYIVIKAIAGKWREIPIGLWVLAVPLVYYFATLVRH